MRWADDDEPEIREALLGVFKFSSDTFDFRFRSELSLTMSLVKKQLYALVVPKISSEIKDDILVLYI